MKGGYILLDCGGLDLVNQSPVDPITGIYKKVKEAYESGKPVYAVNCLWDDVTMSPISFMITYDEVLGNYVGTVSTLQLHISPNDLVVIVNLVES